jgi:hypothetical protein
MAVGPPVARGDEGEEVGRRCGRNLQSRAPGVGELIQPPSPRWPPGDRGEALLQRPAAIMPSLDIISGPGLRGVKILGRPATVSDVVGWSRRQVVVSDEQIE